MSDTVSTMKGGKRIPLIILNGFLGAGKTTLLKSLLVQSHQRGYSVAVIVNDMSELDVDGVLIANTEIVSPQRQNMVSIAADNISSDMGITKLDSAITRLLSNEMGSGNTPDFILLETSGSSHPLPLVRYFRDHPQVCLHAFLSLVDAVMLHEDYDDGYGLITALQQHLEQGKRSVVNLLAEQLMFCNQMILTKHDRLPRETLADIGTAIHPLNPEVGIVAVPWGNLDLEAVLALPPYDFHRVARLIDELTEDIGTVCSPASHSALSSCVIQDERPFHPQRLWDAYHHHMGSGVYRSKGFFWLPGRDDLALLWNQAAGSISLAFISYWKSGVLEHTDSPLTAEERQALQQQLATSSGRFGDRRCDLTIIGEKAEIETFATVLRQCFLTEEEIVWWKKGGDFTDPWPRTVVHMQ
ncbi:CobW family GTP-binding protein [Candidatus Symbiopectobacterium sp. NZEC135]|uniref:CobW family GTP-binding protein n=1 Tax=Candidatus Symbiopectobacterium sp. NZEC135 TaxID=2820471 RepID=UPI002225CE7D|nr:GTP-binding protein [Candidatus Symbiopectobacterium sp. NZEC135]